MSAATSRALYQTLTDQILDFVGLGTPTPDTLRTTLGGRFYLGVAPDSPTVPYGIVRLVNAQTRADYQGDCQNVDLEILLYHRPRSKALDLEDIADLVDQALLRYLSNVEGIIFARERFRDTLPVGVPPAERDVCGIRLLFSLIVWPAWLTQYALEEA